VQIDYGGRKSDRQPESCRSLWRILRLRASPMMERAATPSRLHRFCFAHTSRAHEARDALVNALGARHVDIAGRSQTFRFAGGTRGQMTPSQPLRQRLQGCMMNAMKIASASSSR
jgi:hypothetical protein